MGHDPHQDRTNRRQKLAIYPPDVISLRNQLAACIEDHPPDCWSGPFIVALLGLFHGHSMQCGPEPGQRLRVVT